MTTTLTLADELLALAGKATPGEWCVENPLDETLSIVESGKQTYEWRFIANCTMPDEDDHDFTGREVKANAAYIAACNPANITALCNAVKELSEENARLRFAAKDLLSVLNCDGPETADDPDEGSIGWDGNGPLKITFGHIRRLRALAAGEKTCMDY